MHAARIDSSPTLFPVEIELAADGILETCPVGFVANRVDDGIDHAVQKSQEIPHQDKGIGSLVAWPWRENVQQLVDHVWQPRERKHCYHEEQHSDYFSFDEQSFGPVVSCLFPRWLSSAQADANETVNDCDQADEQKVERDPIHLISAKLLDRVPGLGAFHSRPSATHAGDGIMVQ